MLTPNLPNSNKMNQSHQEQNAQTVISLKKKKTTIIKHQPPNITNKNK